MQEPEEIAVAYPVENYESRWNVIRLGTGPLLYWANRHSRQMFRVSDGYVGGPITGFLGDNVTGQFKEEEIKELCE